MANNDKALVLVIGATGFTGTSIVQGLLASGNFRVAALIRPASIFKPVTAELRLSGVEIRVGDVTDSVESLKKTLGGVDVLISSVVPWLIDQQRDVFRAAKEVGVRRVIPCDFASPGEKGVRALHDAKLGIRKFILDLGVPHTFIDVGWWMQLYLPLPPRSGASPEAKQMTYYVYGDGTSRNLLTDLDRIGTYVARIVADPRTLNRAVMVWEDEVSQNAAHEIGERVSGDGEALKAKRAPVTVEDLLQWTAEAKADIAKDPTNAAAHMKQTMSEYMYHLHFLKENTLENAKRLGYLDARELYPDVPARTLEDYAKVFYGLPEPGAFYQREPEIRLP